ncbi:DUF2634 domain-containing protein [uncultured Lactococcus sp.]|uniref:DUF2634 domain-containing protein n=1 Tax=uncultured Lactococcus sp. TaxID=167973 RepID=UPI0025988A0C|nr:DUF2634 domain-containing protein [uncultured Lactococcus sp.]
MAYDNPIAETDDSIWESKTYLVSFGRIISMTDGLEAMRQAIEKALKTPRFSTAYYTAQYGSDLDTLIGKSMDYVISDLERVIREALDDERILDVVVSEPEQIDKSSLKVDVLVSTIFGTVQTETEVSTS